MLVEFTGFGLIAISNVSPFINSEILVIKTSPDNLTSSSLFYAQKCIDVDPNFITAYELKADIEIGKKNYSSALANYELIKEYLPENLELYLKSGFCHAKLGQIESSCENFEFAEKKGNLLAGDLISLYCK